MLVRDPGGRGGRVGRRHRRREDHRRERPAAVRRARARRCRRGGTGARRDRPGPLADARRARSPASVPVPGIGGGQPPPGRSGRAGRGPDRGGDGRGRPRLRDPAARRLRHARRRGRRPAVRRRAAAPGDRPGVPEGRAAPHPGRADRPPGPRERGGRPGDAGGARVFANGAADLASAGAGAGGRPHRDARGGPGGRCARWRSRAARRGHGGRNVRPFRRLFALAAPVGWWIALAASASFAALAANVALMTAAPYLISRAALVTGFAALALAVTAVRLFAIARASLRYVERYAVHLAAFRVLTHLRVRFYRAVEPLAPAGLGTRRTGDLMARAVADIDTLDAFYVRGVVPPIAALLTAILASVILGSLEPSLALVLLASLSVGGVVVPIAVRRTSRDRASNVVAARSALYAEVADDVTGLSDLMAFGAEEGFGRRVADGSRRIGDGLRSLASVRGAGAAAGSTIAGLAGVVLLAMAIPTVRDGRVEGVCLAAVPLVAMAAFEAVHPLTDAFREIELSRAAAVRTFEVLDADAPVRDPSSPLAVPADAPIEFRHVGFRYGPGSPAVFEDLGFTIAPGEHVAIAGPSGAGKTTIVSLLVRF